MKTHTLPHRLGTHFKTTLTESGVWDVWQKLTPLARNEWICWVTSAKQEKTRDFRTERLVCDIKEGKKRPCCWPGCPHRK